MTEWFNGTGDVISALFSNDVWTLKSAMRLNGVWVVGLFATLIGGFLVMLIYRFVPFIERHLERSVMVVSYLAIGGIISVEVVRRFVFKVQEPWSTTLPPYLFLIMTWIGCSYNVKLRTHLSFAELRTASPRPVQMGLLILDAVLWLGFAWVVFVTSTRVTINSAANFQIMPGTDHVMQWWFMISMPIAFVLLAGRVMQNLVDDLATYKTDRPLIEQAVIGGQ
jgi:TRAP-type C4-dicarboxylate transport system permease small subunit